MKGVSIFTHARKVKTPEFLVLPLRNIPSEKSWLIITQYQPGQAMRWAQPFSNLAGSQNHRSLSPSDHGMAPEREPAFLLTPQEMLVLLL
jgi:hypothetical protein